MAQFIEVINRMNVAERMQVLEYLCTSLAPHFADTTPSWHADELKETEEVESEIACRIVNENRRYIAAA